MRTRVLSIFFVCLAGSVVLTPDTARACSCGIDGPDISDRTIAAGEFAGATVVFEGEVIRLTVNGAPTNGNLISGGVIVFRAIRSYKGDSPETFQVFDPMIGSNCGFDQSAVGRKYFVYGYQDKDGKIIIHACGRTGPLESAGPDLRYARGESAIKEDLLQPDEKWRLQSDPSLATRGATLRGKVLGLDSQNPSVDSSKDWRKVVGLDSQNLSIESLIVWRVDENGHLGKRFVTTPYINRDGSYEFRFLPPGRYMVTVEGPLVGPNARLVGEHGNISLTDSQILDGVDVLLRSEPLGKVTIQVKAPSELHNRIIVFLRDVEIESGGGPPHKYASSGYLDDNGVATFQFVPYGNYNVGVRWIGDNLSYPAWTHEKVQVELNGKQTEAVVTLRRNLPK